MTWQELKGKISFWLIVSAIVFALLSGNFSVVLYLIGVLIAGMIAYQLIGYFFLLISSGNFDPFNIKQKGVGSKNSNKKNNESNKKLFKKMSTKETVGLIDEMINNFFKVTSMIAVLMVLWFLVMFLIN